MGSEIDWHNIHDLIMYHYRLRAVPVAIKYYETEEEMVEILQRTPSRDMCTPCMAVGRAARCDTVIGMTSENFKSDYCRGVHGFKIRDEEWMSAIPFLGKWHSNIEATRGHQQALNVMPVKYHGFVAAPLYKGVIENPDACLMFGTPEQVFWILISSVHTEYKKRLFSFAGESTCNDSWIHTALTGEPGLAIGSYGERYLAGMPEDEMLVSMSVVDVVKALDGAVAIKAGKDGLGYPVSQRLPIENVAPKAPPL